MSTVEELARHIIHRERRRIRASHPRRKADEETQRVRVLGTHACPGCGCRMYADQALCTECAEALCDKCGVALKGEQL